MEVLVTEALRNTADSGAPAKLWSPHFVRLGKPQLKFSNLNCIVQTKQIIWNSTAWQKTTEIYPENNELIECRTSGLRNKIRPFANCSNETECQNRGNSPKKRVIFKTFAANGCRKSSGFRKLSKLKVRSGRIPKLERGSRKKGQSVL